MAYTRWDPRSRAGAVAVQKSTPHDLRAVEEYAGTVAAWARYQDMTGDYDTVEPSPVVGPYGWRSYIQEEVKLAQRRDGSLKPAKKSEAPAPPSAPTGYYA